MLWLAFGYFIAYIPFAALTKALSSGLLPGLDEQVGGLVLLPVAALGVLAGAVAFLGLNGWWRYIGLRPVGGRERRFPSRTMLVAGGFMAVIIGTTILNFTFAGVSILFMLLMMRAGTLALAPAVDTVRRRRIRDYSWAALAFSLIAIAVALAGVDAYALTLGAVLSLAAYLLGYVGRFEIMSRVAKTGDVQVDRRYFAEEQISAAVILLVVCAVLAVDRRRRRDAGAARRLHQFLFTPEAGLAFLVGLFYSALYVFGTLIYLDPREYSWAVPVNRCSSVFSVLRRLLRADLALSASTHPRPRFWSPPRSCCSRSPRSATRSCAGCCARARRWRSCGGEPCSSSAAATPAARRSRRRSPVPSSPRAARRAKDVCDQRRRRGRSSGRADGAGGRRRAATSSACARTRTGRSR